MLHAAAPAGPPTGSPVPHQEPTLSASREPEPVFPARPAPLRDTVETEQSPACQDPEPSVTSPESLALQPAIPSAALPPSAQVVLDYCTATRGVLNDNQGPTLDPPGQRMARALEEIKVSIDECLDAKKGGPQIAR